MSKSEATQRIEGPSSPLGSCPQGDALEVALRAVVESRGGEVQLTVAPTDTLAHDTWEHGASIRLYCGIDEVQDFAVFGSVRSTASMVRSLFGVADDALVVGDRLRDGLGETLNELVGRIKNTLDRSEQFVPRLDTPEVLERTAGEVYAQVRPDAAVYRATSTSWVGEVVFLASPRRRQAIAALEQATAMLMGFGLDRDVMARSCRLLEEVRGPVLALADLPSMGITLSWCIENLAVLVNGLSGFREKALFHRVVRELDSLRGALARLAAPHEATAFAVPQEEDLRSLLDDFCHEVERALNEADAASSSDDAEAVHALFRIMHGIRGNAAFFELQQVERICHATQNVLGAVRDSTGRLSEEQANAVRHTGYLIEDWVGALASSLRSGEAVTWSPDLEAHARMLEHVLECGGRITLPPTRGGGHGPSRDVYDALRLDGPQMERLEAIRAELKRWAQAADDNDARRGALEGAYSELSAICRSVRRVPLSGLLGKLARHCREVAERHGRLVRVDVSGEATSAPEHVTAALSGALVHLVNNAVEHGIEEAAERQALGKSVLASVALRASWCRGLLTLEVSDDGRGIRRHAVLARARAMGKAIDASGPDSALGLAFEPGLSTSGLEGRDGLGLDIVRREAENLGGSVELTSEVGAGTRVRLIIPENPGASAMAEEAEEAEKVAQAEKVELDTDGALNFL